MRSSSGGRVRQARGFAPGALPDLTWAVELDPARADAHHELGQVHRFRGELEAARAEFGRAIELDRLGR